MNYNIKKEQDLYVCRDPEGEVAWSSYDVGILYSAVQDGENEELVLHKLGPREAVEKRYREIIAENSTFDFRFVTGPFEPEELNRCLSTTGYITQYLRKINIEH